MMHQEQDQRNWWTVVRVIGYDWTENRGVMEVVATARTREDANQYIDQAQDPNGLMVFPKPFLREPKIGEQYGVPPGLDEKLDQVVEDAKQWLRADLLATESIPNREKEAPSVTEDPNQGPPPDLASESFSETLDEYRQQHLRGPKL